MTEPLDPPEDLAGLKRIIRWAFDVLALVPKGDNVGATVPCPDCLVDPPGQVSAWRGKGSRAARAECSCGKRRFIA